MLQRQLAKLLVLVISQLWTKYFLICSTWLTRKFNFLIDSNLIERLDGIGITYINHELMNKNWLYFGSYWYQFAPLNPLWHSILGFVMVLFTIVALAGNFVVISIFISTSTLRTPTNLLVVNLAISDFLMMLTMVDLPHSKIFPDYRNISYPYQAFFINYFQGPMMVVNCMNETWVFGPFLCEIYGMLGSLFGCASIWTM